MKYAIFEISDMCLSKKKFEALQECRFIKSDIAACWCEKYLNSISPPLLMLYCPRHKIRLIMRIETKSTSVNMAMPKMIKSRHIIWFVISRPAVQIRSSAPAKNLGQIYRYSIAPFLSIAAWPIISIPVHGARLKILEKCWGVLRKSSEPLFSI